jgi:hypothetical protein
MYHHKAVDLIEQHHRDRPFCAACASPTVTIARHGAIWLECSTLGEPKSTLRRLFSLDALEGHTREMIIDTDFAMVA